MALTRPRILFEEDIELSDQHQAHVAQLMKTPPHERNSEVAKAIEFHRQYALYFMPSQGHA